MALDLPAHAREAVMRWRDEALGGRRDLRPVAPEALHVTLVFLGWQAEKDVERIADATFGALEGHSAARLTPTGVQPVPPRRPRLFALDLADSGNAAAAVQDAASSALAAAGFYRPEARPFWPHVTLARVKRGARAGPLEASPPPGDEFTASLITLYRSTLLPQGAVYEPLRRYELARM